MLTVPNNESLTSDEQWRKFELVVGTTCKVWGCTRG